MEFSRASGILLHPTSLPSPFGIGDLGSEAYRFVDFLSQSGQTYWQILPLGPTGYGNSPYSSFSAFAGNYWLISPEKLIEDGLLTLEACLPIPEFSSEKVDFEAVQAFKMALYEKAFLRFRTHASPLIHQQFERFRHARQNRIWLKDYALFMAFKEGFDHKEWTKWEEGLVFRDPKTLKGYEKRLSDRILFYEFLQFLFFKQWEALKGYARQNQISLIGDIPIFVAHDSVDVWSHPDLFFLDEEGNPTIISGVPPDYFSKTGQRWGNPLYRWDRMAETGYAWWIERFKMILSLVDVVRIDHFRGFSAYWAVPVEEETAMNGEWQEGPKDDFFLGLERALGKLPIIAEDLGVITPDVEALRDQFMFPGMKILQFAFGSGPENTFLPHNLIQNCVVYTGTHDNDTTLGWFKSADKDLKMAVCAYLGTEGREIHWDMIRLALSSVAKLALFPLQDVLGLDTNARMNLPGKEKENWAWRYSSAMLNEDLAHHLRHLTEIYGRNKNLASSQS